MPCGTMHTRDPIVQRRYDTILANVSDIEFSSVRFQVGDPSMVGTTTCPLSAMNDFGCDATYDVTDGIRVAFLDRQTNP